MMGPLDVLKDVICRFERAKVEYFLVGSLGAMYYSRPRFTDYIDLVVQIKPQQVRDFEGQFLIDEYYCPPFEIVRDEVLRDGSFNLIHHGSGIRIDIVLHKNSDFYRSEFQRRRKVHLLPDFEAYIASPEDIILKKLDFYREGNSQKHIQDIKEILAETPVDRVYLEEWVARLRLGPEWDLVK